MHSLEKPLLIYDGSCGFCQKWVDRLKIVTKEKLEFAPFQEVANDFPQIPEVEFTKSVFLIEPNGKITRAAHAAFRALALSKWWGWALFLYTYLPGFAFLSEWVYRVIARNRSTSCNIHVQ